MDKQRFRETCEQVIHAEREKNGIGTLGEKTLHAVLKQYIEPQKAYQEMKIGPFVADICTGDGIIEIQTGAFHKLRKKLEAFLKVTSVTIVYPIPRVKWIVWVDRNSGEVLKKRKSPKQGQVYDSFYELYKIKEFLPHSSLQVCLALIDMEEYRYVDAGNKSSRRGYHLIDRIPSELAEEVCLCTPEDYALLIPPTLGAQFTSKDYKAASKLSLSNAQTALNVLYAMNAVRRTGKIGNLLVYERENTGGGLA